MKILYEDIADRLYPKPTINQLSEKLFQLGHEHEVIDNIFDFELTPNRGDCLSLNGLLRDLNLFYEIRIENDIYTDDIKTFNLNFQNNAENFCPNISFLKIEVNSLPDKYNKLLESYFSNYDIKKNNFFTDISNYVSHETGQPTHCYSAEKLNDCLRLDYTDKKIKFLTLHGKKIILDDSNLVFFDENNIPINLAGIVGSQETSCNSETKSVVIECAYFEPEVILGKAVKYNIVSDASHKFERSTDIACHNYVLRRFIKIVEQHAEIINIELFTSNSSKLQNNSINFDAERINKILGTNISEKNQMEYLKKLGFIGNNNIIEIPTYRKDISSINDIAEEIARAVGFNNIEPKKININFDNYNNNLSSLNENRLRSLLSDKGFYEVVNDPFVSTHKKKSISIDNPLDTQRKYLRTSLKSSLLKNLEYNERRQHESVKLFEIADIYTIESTKKMLGIIASGRIDNNYRDFSKNISGKYIQDIIDNNVTNIQINQIDVSRELIASKKKSPIIYIEAEITENIDVKYNVVNDKKNYINDYKFQPFSDFPSSTRDLSFSLKDFSKSELFIDLILNFKNKLLKNAFIFDFYVNHEKQEVKIGFRFVFQSSVTTVTDDAVNVVIEEIIKNALAFDSVDLPGIF